MKARRTAIIDLGTNTFHLLVADEFRHIIYEVKMPVKMGMGGINDSTITDAAIERSVECLKTFAKTCKEMKVETIKAFGTSALRSAVNAVTVAGKIKTETGIDVTVISGEEEARLIYLGVRQAVTLGNEKSLIVDIGGGSVEFIIAGAKEIFWKQSIEVGGQRLLERFHHHEPILPGELKKLNEYLETAIDPLKEPLSKHNPQTLVGSSGTFETLSDIYCERKNVLNLKSPESPLTKECFMEIYNDLIQMNKAERIAMPGMMVWRAEMIVVTCTLIRFLLEKYPFNHIKVSRYSLKEGILYSS